MSQSIARAIMDRKQRFLIHGDSNGYLRLRMMLIFRDQSLAFETGPDDPKLLRISISSHIATGVTMGVMWCICVYYAETFVLARFFGKLMAKEAIDQKESALNEIPLAAASQRIDVASRRISPIQTGGSAEPTSTALPPTRSRFVSVLARPNAL